MGVACKLFILCVNFPENVLDYLPLRLKNFLILYERNLVLDPDAQIPSGIHFHILRLEIIIMDD